ncbi:MAG: ParA family protein [Archangiaceae bacterium]|nr:ParA family protein [Archangiaceae bacterium]
MAAAIAWELLHRGHKVLVVDTDPQGTLREVGQAAADGNKAPVIVAMGKELHRLSDEAGARTRLSSRWACARAAGRLAARDGDWSRLDPPVAAPGTAASASHRAEGS